MSDFEPYILRAAKDHAGELLKMVRQLANHMPVNAGPSGKTRLELAKAAHDLVGRIETTAAERECRP